MRFDLSDDQRLFQNVVADYLAAECPPTRTLKAHEDAATDKALWLGLMELGLGGVTVPAAHGGLGLNMLDLAVVAEVIGRFAAPGRYFAHALATQAIILGGSDAQQARWLPALATGELCGTVALAEDKGIWLADDWRMPAGSDLTGTKRYVPHAADADLIVVGIAGGKLAIVERDARGMTMCRAPSTDGGRPLSEVMFQDTPCEPLAEPIGGRLCDAGMILLAADALGGATHCVDASVEYAKEREQFGKPIGTFQAVKHQLADMAVEVEPSVGLFWYAADAFDNDPAEAPKAIALAKSHLTDLYAAVSRRMIEAHGGIGYTWEFGAHIWLKRAVFDRAFLGMPHLHRARYADLAGW